MSVFGPFERMVAMRYLGARRKGFVSVITWFSLLGIALGVGTLIVVMAVMNGLSSEIVGRILGLNGHIGVYGPSTVEGSARGLADFDALAARVRGVPGVRSVTPTVEEQAMVMTDAGRMAGAIVRGMRNSDLMARAAVASGIQAGALADLTGTDTVMLGVRMAQKLGVQVGDEIQLLSADQTATAFGMMPHVRHFRVVAIFNVGMYEYDSGYVFMPIEAAQNFFKMPGRVTDLQVMVDDPTRVDTDVAAIQRVVDPSLSIIDWQRANSPLVGVLKVQGNVMFLILAMIILVAAFNIISGLFMLVKDKSQDIAILRTMGATRGMVMRIFFLSGASIGVIGTGTGVGLGLAFALNIEAIRQFVQKIVGQDLFAAEIYWLSTLPAKVDPTEVFHVVLMALGLSFAATLYPAWRAARLDPVEALRYE